MSIKSTEAEESTESLTEKRARYEGMEFRVPVSGKVRVENVSYGEKSEDHVYIVAVESGETVSCSCPSDVYQAGKCKHRIRVENEPAVMLAAGSAEGEGETSARSEEACLSCGNSYPKGETCGCGGVDEL